MSQNREHMSAIGREGGESRAASQTRRREGGGSPELEMLGSRSRSATGSSPDDEDLTDDEQI